MSPGQLGGGPLVETGHLGYPVSLGHGQHHTHRTADLDEASEAVRHSLVEAEGATQQRAPRKQDGNEVGGSVELGREGLSRRHDEQRVGQTAGQTALPCSSGGTSRRLGHRRGVGVDTEHKGPGLAGRRGEDGAAITRTEVDDHPLGAGDPVGDLADVHLSDPTARDDTHSWRSVAPGSRPYTLRS